jgi:hypothetical protein
LPLLADDDPDDDELDELPQAASATTDAAAKALVTSDLVQILMDSPPPQRFAGPAES